MSNHRAFEDFPPAVRVSSRETSRRYVLARGRFAIHGDVPGDAGVEIETEIEGEGEVITICRGDADRMPSAARTAEDHGRVSPVYALEPDGPPAVASGLIHVRFARRVSARQRSEELARAGYEVVTVPDHAPHTAWVRAADTGDVAAALNQVDRLEALEEVENVEPQMLRAVSRR